MGCCVRVCCLAAMCTVAAACSSAAPRTRNVIIIAIDGVRWHEVFAGADPTLMQEKAGFVRDRKHTEELFWRPTLDARREALMPFLWSTVARQGQIFGDRSRNCLANVENEGHASRECYSELLRGFDDPPTYGPGPDRPVNVLEWLNGREAFKGRISVQVVWEPLLEIADVQRGGLRGFGGWQRLAPPLSEEDRAVNGAIDELPRIWSGATFDFAVMHSAMRDLHRARPRVMFIALNEADEWAHLKRYDLYLQAIHKSDRFIRRLWETIQSMPQYRGRTSLVIVTDHGRGDGEKDWMDHRAQAPGSGDVWYAVIGPDTPPLGVRSDLSVSSGQIAATIAQLVGLDFTAGDGRRRPPLPGVVVGR